jgi:opacity protein-like surface antigen
MKKFFLTAATLLALATPVLANDDCEVNLDQYNQLKVGMRYSQIVEILGCEGTLTFSAKGAGYKFENYNWEGMHVTLSSGSLNSKGHTGLVPAGVAKPVQKGIVINIDINHVNPKATVEVAPKSDATAIGQKALDAVAQ